MNTGNAMNTAEKKTNLDKVRGMDAKELVHFFCPAACPNDDMPCPPHQKCTRCWIAWLKARAGK